MSVLSLRPHHARPVAACFALAALLAGSLPGAVPAAELQRIGADSRRDLVVTVYNQDLALISERREVDLAPGRNRLALDGVSDQLQPETVLLGGPGFELLSQSYSTDLVTPQRLLEAAVGKTVELVRIDPASGKELRVEAELLSVAQGPVLRVGDRIETAPPGRIVFREMPEGLFRRPTLLFELDSADGGATGLDLRYLTGGLSWRADYVARLNESGDRLRLAGLVTLTNGTDLAFEGAVLRLVAGEVSRAGPGVPRPEAMVMDMAVRSAAAPRQMPEARAAADRYLYELPRPIDLGRNETRQVPLLEADEVTVTQSYRFPDLVSAQPSNGEIGPIHAELLLTLENEAAQGLGRPLPAGAVRVYQPIAGGGEIFAGADEIGHAAEGESLELRLGRAFDVTARARHTGFERLSDRSFESAQEIVVENAKGRPVTVEIAGSFPNGWRIVEESVPHVREGGNRVAWTLEVPAGGSATLRYRVRVAN